MLRGVFFALPICIVFFFCSCTSDEQNIKKAIIETKLDYTITFVSMKIQDDKATVHTKESCYIVYKNGGWRYWVDAPATYHLEKVGGKWRIE